MSVIIRCEPGKWVSREELLQYPPYTIGVDGFCDAEPFTSPDGLIINIDHHKNVYRMATRACCAQARILVKMGLFERFQVNGEPTATLCVNAGDQDVSHTTYILMHPEHVDRPMLRALIETEDVLDMSAGLFPIKTKWKTVKRLAWISEMHTEMRTSGALDKYRDDIDTQRRMLLEAIDDAHKRITKTLFGSGKMMELDTRFETLYRFPRWVFTHEIGQHARLGMMEKRITAFVSLLSESDGRYEYAIGRRSTLIPFPNLRLYENLNAAEGIALDAPEKWGGGDTTGGSPRKTGSRLRPAEVVAVVNATLAEEVAA
jgi:hypothetical protein